jgi:ComEC/Rec2-related protein
MRISGSGMCGGVARFCSRHPLFAVALVAAACVTVADWRTGWGVFAAVVFGLAGGFLTGWRLALAWGICGGLAVGVFSWRDGARQLAEANVANLNGGMMSARVLQDGQGSPGGWVVPARILSGSAAGTIVWWEGRGELPVAGAVVQGSGNFLPLPEMRNPGEFDRASWLRRQGVAAVFQTGWSDNRVETGNLPAIGAKIRHGFRDWVTAGLEEDSQEARVIRAVVIGETPPDADALIAAFRNSGTLHVFSVSGLHVAMVGSIGWLVLSWAGVPRRWAVLALLPLVFGYSWITGNSPPAVRSAWMAAVFLGAFVFRRKPDLLNALGAVLLAAMLWDGRLLFQPGVQLSYGVVAAIAVGTAWAARSFAWMAVPELYLPERLMSRWQQRWLEFRRRTAQSLAVSLAAGVGSTPLTAIHFGLVTPISVLAGLVLVPLVYALLVAALTAVVLHPLAAPVARVVNRLNGRVANGCVLAAEGFAAVPGGHFRIGRETEPMLLVYDLGYGAGAACFSGGRSGAVMIDCGDFYGFKQRVAPSLRRLGIEPDSVVLSHPDGGHLGGGPPVFEAFPIRQALLPVKLSRSPSFRSWIEAGPRAGIHMRQAVAGDSLPFPDAARLEILHAPDPLAHNALADERVAVFRLHWRGWKILFTSDAGMGTELKMLDAGKDLSADLIIAGRHRADLTLCDRFLDAVRPRAIIASNSPFPIEERLAPGTVDFWRSRGIEVIDQAQSGGVTVRVDDSGNLSLDGFLSPAPLVLKAP